MLNYFRKKKQEKMNKIVDEVVRQIEVKMEDLFDDFVSRLNGQEIDYEKVWIDYSELVEHVDMYELAENVEVDASDVAYHIDINDVADNIHCDDVANELDTSEIANFVEVDFDDLKKEIFNEVRSMIEDAVDEVETSIDHLTISRA
jgi:hypothetical protein